MSNLKGNRGNISKITYKQDNSGKKAGFPLFLKIVFGSDMHFQGVY
jgi:hypothetical protein